MRSFSSWSHVVCLLFAQLTHALGLNDVCDALRLHSGPLSAIRGATPPSRNGLSHANKVRPAALAEELFWKMLEHLGLRQSQTLPGYPQLMRPCDIEGHLVYHLTTFFEKGGMVTVFAFDQPVKLSEDHGWWGNVYWQVVASRDGKPLVMVAQKKHALSVAQATFSPADPAQSPP